MTTRTLQSKTCDSKFFLPFRTVIPLLVTLLSLSLVPFAAGNPPLFYPEDIKDPGSLAVKLQDTRATVSKSITVQLSDKTQQLISEYDGINSPSPMLQKALLTDLNRLIQDASLYDAQSFSDIELSEQTQSLIAQEPQSGNALVRLNRALLADAYPYELASHSEHQTADNSTEIQTCRENLRKIKLALENYRADADGEPQWLSELSPQYLKKDVLLCPADLTTGVPGVLTEGAADPMLQCSYLYELRPGQKEAQEILLRYEGDMLPIVRCQHHLLNLSVSGKLYRNGPQRNIYNTTARIVSRISIQPSSLADLPTEVRKQIEETPPNSRNEMSSTTVLRPNGSGNLHAQLKEQLGEAFLESLEGKALLKQLTQASLPVTNREELAYLLGKPMPDIALTDLSGKSVKLETLRGKFVLVNLFPADPTTYGPKLQHLEKLLENYTTQLQVVNISTNDSVKAIEELKEKYQLSMLTWIGKNDQIQAFLNREISKPQTQLTTILLNQELIVKDVFIDLDLQHLSQSIKKLVQSKE